MKPHVIIISVVLNFFSIFRANAQDSPSEIGYNFSTNLPSEAGMYYKPKPNKGLNSVGVSVGQESFIGVKLGAYQEFSLIRKRKNDRNFNTLSLYIGPEASIFVFYAGVFSVSATGGIAFGPFTIDNAITYTTVMSPESKRVCDYGSWNPKIGLQLGPVWLKAGPSYLISGSPSWKELNFMEINEQLWNFEIRYIGRIYR